MLDMYLVEKEYKRNIKEAISNLKENNFEVALDYIHKAMFINDSSGEVHNLLGIYYEKKGDLNMSGKHYRAAWDLEPTFKAPMNNLQRITSYNYKRTEKYIEYGEDFYRARINLDTKNLYTNLQSK